MKTLGSYCFNQRVQTLLATLALTAACSASALAEVVTVGIGIQSTTTNTVTGGIVIEKLGLMDKYLAELKKTPKYKDIDFKFDWQNSPSAPPITNGMVANKLQIGMMGDYPLLINGATFQASNETQTMWIALLAYNLNGAGNGMVVHKDSPYYQLSDLKGKKVSVPFGSAAHGMLLKAMEDRGWKEDFWELASQSPEVGTTNLQERKLDGHANFVPFAELLPYRGFARKIFDGVETKVPTFHGVVVRKDFADKYPEFVVVYLKALLDANDWVRKDPVMAATKIEEWTKVDKEVVYMFLGPSGVHTLDPSIKPKWIEALKNSHGVLQRMGRVKEFNADIFSNETFIKQAFKDKGLDYDKQKDSFAGYEISGTDPLCKKPIKNPREGGEVWIEGGNVTAYSSTVCTMAGVKKALSEGKKIGVAFVFDKTLSIKLFADKAFYSLNTKNPNKPEIVPFLLKKDAEEWAAKNEGRLATYTEVLAVANVGG